jgi:hypothetical protein
MKALYRNKMSGDIFAIETDAGGNVLSTAGLLLTKDLDPKHLDYDNYFTGEVSAKIKDFILLRKENYLDILYRNGFARQSTQCRFF